MRNDLFVKPRERLLVSKENKKVELIHRWRPLAGQGLRAIERPEGTTLHVTGALMPPTPWRVSLGDGFFMIRPGLCKGVEVSLPGGAVLALTGDPQKVELQKGKPLVGLKVKFRVSAASAAGDRSAEIESITVGQIAALEDLQPYEGWRTLAILKGPPSAPNSPPVRVLQVVRHHQDFTATGDVAGWKDVRFFWWAVP